LSPTSNTGNISGSPGSIGTGVSGTGVSGTGVSGTGVSGTGVSGATKKIPPEVPPRTQGLPAALNGGSLKKRPTRTPPPVPKRLTSKFPSEYSFSSTIEQNKPTGFVLYQPNPEELNEQTEEKKKEETVKNKP